jgi:hypothetical protein
VIGNLHNNWIKNQVEKEEETEGHGSAVARSCLPQLLRDVSGYMQIAGDALIYAVWIPN